MQPYVIGYISCDEFHAEDELEALPISPGVVEGEGDAQAREGLLSCENEQNEQTLSVLTWQVISSYPRVSTSSANF